LVDAACQVLGKRVEFVVRSFMDAALSRSLFRSEVLSYLTDFHLPCVASSESPGGQIFKAIVCRIWSCWSCWFGCVRNLFDQSVGNSNAMIGFSIRLQ